MAEDLPGWKTRPILCCETCETQVVPLSNGDLIWLAGRCPRCRGDLQTAGTCLVRWPVSEQALHLLGAAPARGSEAYAVITAQPAVRPGSEGSGPASHPRSRLLSRHTVCRRSLPRTGLASLRPSRPPAARRARANSAAVPGWPMARRSRCAAAKPVWRLGKEPAWACSHGCGLRPGSCHEVLAPFLPCDPVLAADISDWGGGWGASALKHTHPGWASRV